MLSWIHRLTQNVFYPLADALDVSSAFSVKALLPNPSQAQITLYNPLINSLPPELLCLVFTEILAQPNSDPSKCNYPLLFGQVCRYWRAVVLSTPTLWASLKVKFGRRPHTRELATIDHWLMRSGGLCSLTITIEDEEHGEWVHDCAGSAIHKIIAHCRRWRHLSVKVSPDTFESFERVQGALPLLESLELSLASVRPHWAQALPRDMFSNAPRLHKVNLGFGLHPSLLDLPWDQLTEITTPSEPPLRIDECLDILRRCPNLVKCTFQAAADSPFPRAGTTVHEHLHTLSMTSREFTPLKRLLDGLTLPALCDISVHSSRAVKAESRSQMELAVAALVLRSRCSLQSVWLNQNLVDTGLPSALIDEELEAEPEHLK